MQNSAHTCISRESRRETEELKNRVSQFGSFRGKPGKNLSTLLQLDCCITLSTVCATQLNTVPFCSASCELLDKHTLHVINQTFLFGNRNIVNRLRFVVRDGDTFSYLKTYASFSPYLLLIRKTIGMQEVFVEAKYGF